MSGDDLSDQALMDINRLFVAALLALAEAGRADDACRLAAKGWSALRERNEREAERLSAALHSLTRRVPGVFCGEKGAIHE